MSTANTKPFKTQIIINPLNNATMVSFFPKKWVTIHNNMACFWLAGSCIWPDIFPKRGSLVIQHCVGLMPWKHVWTQMKTTIKSVVLFSQNRVEVSVTLVKMVFKSWCGFSCKVHVFISWFYYENGHRSFVKRMCNNFVGIWCEIVHISL